MEIKTLDLRTIMSILGARPYPLPAAFKEYLSVVEVGFLLSRKLMLRGKF